METDEGHKTQKPDDGSTSEEADGKKERDPAIAILLAAQTFILDAEALVEILQVSKPVLIAKEQERREELKTLINRAKTDDHGYREVHQLLGLVARLVRGGFLFRGHLLVALVSRFDAFVGEVARELLLAFPDRLGTKSVTFAEAAKFGSIEELKQQIVEDEVDKKMRESHTEQLDFLSSLANVKLGSDEPELLKRFVELTERRNCHVHCGGNVSPQYRRICNERGILPNRSLKDGERLNVTVSYIRSARRVLSELAFKISQTIVRKIFPDSQGIAEMHLNTIGLEFLNEHRWSEALMVFDYAANLRGTSAGTDGERRNNVINKAQALIGLKKTEEAMKVINGIDWSASHPKYTMAIHLLKGEFDKAAELIPVAGLPESEYRTWPLFEAFRQTEQFNRGFLSHFGHDFNTAALGAVTQAIAEIETNPGAAHVDAILPEETLMGSANLGVSKSGEHGSLAKSEQPD